MIRTTKSETAYNAQCWMSRASVVQDDATIKIVGITNILDLLQGNVRIVDKIEVE